MAASTADDTARAPTMPTADPTTVRRGSARAIASAAAQPASDAGSTRGNPAPLGATVEAGPLAITVASVVAGQEATDLMLAASPLNAPPRDGVTYVLANVTAANGGPNPVHLSSDDFALVGASGLVRRFLDVQAPEPALNGEIAPGQSSSGWVALSAPADEANLTLIADPQAFAGDWAVRYLALSPDPAALPATAPQPVNDAGRDPGAPAGIGVPVVTGQWRLTLQKIVTGAPAFDLVDYRTGALKVDDATGESDGSVWIALRFAIANNAAGERPATFPANAFSLTGLDGAPLLDLMTLTPPEPDAAGQYFPGAEREGWVMFDVPFEIQPVLVRFQPYAHSDPAPDPRHFPSS